MKNPLAVITLVATFFLLALGVTNRNYYEICCGLVILTCVVITLIQNRRNK